MTKLFFITEDTIAERSNNTATIITEVSGGLLQSVESMLDDTLSHMKVDSLHVLSTSAFANYTIFWYHVRLEAEKASL
jgi:hypothetical protein